MSFQTISAVLRGRWLIDRQWVSAHLPLVFGMIRGESPDFGLSKDESCAIKRVAQGANAYSVRNPRDLSKLPNGSIAVVNISGPLMKQGDICSYGMLDHAELLNQIANTPNIKGAILDLDSPGGQVDGTATLGDSVRNLKQRKPVVGLVNDGMAASAGYWVISGASEIYVSQPTDQVGSVGVYTTIADWNAHYKDHYHLPVSEIYAPQSTDKNLDYKEALAGNDTLVKEDLKVLADQFINTVKRNRGNKIQGSDWQTGKMFYAKDAKKQGLIDGVKNMGQVISRINELIN